MVAGDGPAIFPQEGSYVEHARSAAIEICFPVQRKFLHAIGEVDQSEMARPNYTAT